MTLAVRIPAALIAFMLAACGGRVTPPPVEDPLWAGAIEVVAAGDIADCRRVAPAESGAAQTAALVRVTDVVILTLGDNAYPVGATAEFADCFHSTWGKFGARLRPSPGNHEYQTPGARGYFEYFGARAGPEERGYYSFELAGWHVISMNSAIDASAGSPQHDWLVEDLNTASAVPCTLAVWHHPVFSSGPHGNDPRMKAALAALHAAGTEIVLVAHDHVYERLERHDASGIADPLRGLRSFTVGTGGARLYQFKAIHPLSLVRESAHGVLRLTLAAGKYRWEFIPVGGGQALDRGEGECHR